MHSGGFELAKLTYTRLEDNLIRHRGDLYTLPGTIQTLAPLGCLRPTAFGRVGVG